MKRFLLLTLMLTAAIISYAQIPQQFAFQGIARDAANKPVVNQLVSVRFTLHQGSESGATVYQETHSPQTTTGGVFNVAVGTGSVSSGSFSAINWSSGPYFLQVELDPAGGNSYATVSVTQLQSVPYSLTAKNLEGIINPQNGDTMEYKDGVWIKKPKVKRYHFSGVGRDLFSTFGFVTSTVTIAVEQDNPTITLSATKAFGSNLNNGGESMELVLGYRKNGDIQAEHMPFNSSDVFTNFRVSTRIRVPFTLSGTFQTNFKAGEVYEIGMLGKSPNGTSWNDNGPSTGFVEVSY